MKKVFISGASSGIGEQLAYAYAKPGWVIGCMARRQERLIAVAQRCEALGATVKTYVGDVADQQACQTAIEDFLALPGAIDTVYANAGIGGSDELSSGNATSMNTILSTNILGVVNTVLPFIPGMMAQGSGKVAVVTSVVGYVGVPHRAAYSGSKAALRNICQGWRLALSAHQISVSTICPGFIRTEMTEQLDVPRPFIMPADVAAAKIKRAVSSGKKYYILPWQYRMASKLLIVLPEWVLGRALSHRKA